MRTFYAFGQTVPQTEIEELLLDGMKEEDITTDFLETLYEYEKRDNEEN